MSGPVTWQVQAHRLLGDRSQSYAPVHSATRADALWLADEMADTLSQFVGLEIRIERRDGAP